MKAIIIGAGIGGLTAGIALKQRNQAATLGKKIRAEDGVAQAIGYIEVYIRQFAVKTNVIVAQ